ncbi:MAG: hypothetical protein ISN29_10745 [Gammaproteobacteria bacterium AqS3]|nr:hypothetical protein [Gammaproteobacteria bacterium AqS3]
MKRPLQTRQINGNAFGEDLIILNTNQERDEWGELVPAAVVKTSTKCSTNPISADDERLGDLQESGVRLEGVREFFTVEPLDVRKKQEIEWMGEKYIAVQTANWGHFNATIGIRKEVQ